MKIVYLAPEIPALSATFVYNEILEMNKRGFHIIPVSIHYPHAYAEDVRQDLALANILYLYNEPKIKILLSSLLLFLSSPLKYTKTAFTAFIDACRVGFFNRIGMGLQFRFFMAAHAARIFKKNNVDLIHTHFAHIPTDIAMYASLLSGIPFTFTSHANDLFERSWLIKEKVERSSKAVTISEYNVDFIKGLGIQEEKIAVVRCGVEALSTLSLRENLSCSDDVFKIGTLGRLVEKKGISLLIEAFSIIYKGYKNIRLEIAGDGPLRGQLEEQVQALGLAGTVTFKGPLSHDQVNGWLKTLDVFCLACVKDCNGDQDGIPVVLMEAMIAKIPVISTSLSGIPELIEHGNTGLLAEPGNAQDLSDKLESLIVNIALKDKMIKNAYEHINQEFDRTVNINRLIKIFEDIVHENRT